ncbi:hypothetical protein D3C72_2181110 [compost metagenome]
MRIAACEITAEPDFVERFERPLALGRAVQIGDEPQRFFDQRLNGHARIER